MSRPRAFRTCFVVWVPLGVAALLVGCGGEPEIKVEVAQAPAAEAPADAPAAAAPSATPVPMASGHGSAVPIDPNAPLPAGHPPLDAAPALEVAPVDPATGTGAAGLAWTVPASWIAEPPSNTMRRAQYRIPGPGGDAECVVFYFGPGQGGDPESNAARWASQFVGPDGAAAVAKTRTLEVAGKQVLVVEAAGTYMAGSMMGGPGEPRPNQALLGAVVPGPDANWFFKMTGPEATIESARAAFESTIQSVRAGN